MGREGQRVQVLDHRRDGGDDDFVAVPEVEAGNVAVFGSFTRLQRRHELEQAVLGLAFERIVDVRMFRSQRLAGHDRQVGAAEDGGQAVALGSGGHGPGVADQRRGGGDADEFDGPAVLLGLLDIVLDRIVLDGGIVDHDLMAVVAQDGGQVAQAQGDVLALGPDFRFGTCQDDSHGKMGLNVTG